MNVQGVSYRIGDFFPFIKASYAWGVGWWDAGARGIVLSVTSDKVARNLLQRLPNGRGKGL
jgi:hypothetical protein